MSTKIFCNACGARFLAKPEWAGKRVKCKQCGNVFTVAFSDGDASAGSSFHEPSLLEDDRPAPAPKSPRAWTTENSTVAVPARTPLRDPMASAMAAIESDAESPPLPPLRRATRQGTSDPVASTIEYREPGTPIKPALTPALDSPLSGMMESGMRFIATLALSLIAMAAIHNGWKARQAGADWSQALLNGASSVGSYFAFCLAVWAGTSVSAKLLKHEKVENGFVRARATVFLLSLSLIPVVLLPDRMTAAIMAACMILPVLFVLIRYAFRQNYLTTFVSLALSLVTMLGMAAIVGVIVGLGTVLVGVEVKKKPAVAANPPSTPGPVIQFRNDRIPVNVPAAGPVSPRFDVPARVPTNGAAADAPAKIPGVPAAVTLATGAPMDTDGAAKAWGALRKTVDAAVALKPTANNVGVIRTELARIRASATNVAERYGRTSDDAAKVYAGIITIEDLLKTAEAAAGPVATANGAAPVTVPDARTPAATPAPVTENSTDVPLPVRTTAVPIARPSDETLIDGALADLLGNDPAAYGIALRILIDVKPNAKRNEVAAAIETLLLNKDAKVVPEATTALKVWWGDKTAIRLLALLDPDGDPERRHAAMEVLAVTKDRRAVWPITRWLIQDSQSASKALIQMGPVAEDDVLKLLAEKNGSARPVAAKILAEIGTQKSLSPLAKASKDSRDPVTAAVAARAVEAVKDRVAQGKK